MKVKMAENRTRTAGQRTGTQQKQHMKPVEFLPRKLCVLLARTREVADFGQIRLRGATKCHWRELTPQEPEPLLMVALMVAYEAARSLGTPPPKPRCYCLCLHPSLDRKPAEQCLGQRL